MKEHLKNVFVVDVEADGPCPGLYSMVSFGAVCVGDPSKTFMRKVRPITTKWEPSALAVSKITRLEHEAYGDPFPAIAEFDLWLDEITTNRKIFISDNPAFDWQFINYYFHLYLDRNPFGFSARRIGDIYSGLKRQFSNTSTWKRMRKTKHDHSPVNDAMGNVEALLEILKEME